VNAGSLESKQRGVENIGRGKAWRGLAHCENGYPSRYWSNRVR
jgi:hypothetical protein